MHALERHFLRFRKSTREYAIGPEGTAFGTPFAHHFTLETNGRGGLHLHGLVWPRVLERYAEPRSAGGCPTRGAAGFSAERVDGFTFRHTIAAGTRR
jgi:hypothetical protein